MGFVSRVLQVGVVSLAFGVLIYLASRSVGGGLAGIGLSGLFSWLGFEVALSLVRDIWRFRKRVEPRHTMLGGCVAVIAGFATSGFILLFGRQMILGVILGAVAATLTNRTSLPTLSQVAGFDPMPATLGAGGPAVPGVLRPVAVLVALLCLLAGIGFAGLGTFRVLQGYSYATDTACAHPCAMMYGLWVRVLPDANGDFVTRLDSDAVQVRMRFTNDVAADQTATREGFTLTKQPASYRQVANGQGCEAWGPQVPHIGDSTQPRPLCFAIPASSEVDLSQLTLEWAKAGVTAPILMGKTARSGIGFDVSTG